MAIDDRKKIKEKIERAIEEQNKLIQSLEKTSKPVAPDNAIGRLTRMEAINSKSVSETSLAFARSKVRKLEKALKRIDDSGFGICLSCGNPIPNERIMLMPESTICIPCAERK